jgi:hypothetical protein
MDRESYKNKLNHEFIQFKRQWSRNNYQRSDKGNCSQHPIFLFWLAKGNLKSVDEYRRVYDCYFEYDCYPGRGDSMQKFEQYCIEEMVEEQDESYLSFYFK